MILLMAFRALVSAACAWMVYLKTPCSRDALDPVARLQARRTPSTENRLIRLTRAEQNALAGLGGREECVSWVRSG